MIKFILLLLLPCEAYAQERGRYYYEIIGSPPSLSETPTAPQVPLPVMTPKPDLPAKQPVFTPPPSALPRVVPNQPPFVFPTPPGVGQSVQRK